MSDIVYIKARKCIRCGRMLTSETAITKGLGCRCEQLEKAQEIEEQIEGQYSIMDYMKEGEQLGNTENCRNWRHRHREQYLEYRKKWRNSASGKASERASQKKYRNTEHAKYLRRKRWYIKKCRYTIDYKEEDEKKVLLCEHAGEWISVENCRGCEQNDKKSDK